MAEKKVLLNYLPPATIYYPSPSLSILKSFLKTHDYQADIKYWNFQLNSIITGSLDEEITDTEIKLMPFYALLAEEKNDKEATNKILAYLHKVKSDICFERDKTYENYLTEIKQKALRIINTELDKIDLKNVLLFGISYKLYQWIPGIILAKAVKARSPETKIIMGGFENKDTARVVMNLCEHIDFAVWGEGEYPMLDICEQLYRKKSSFENVARLIYRNRNKIVSSKTNIGKYLDFDNYIFPDYVDYAPLTKKIKRKDLSYYPVNSIRSCHWKKCKFCNYSQGYKYRERSPRNIINELEFISEKYDAYQFMFVDNDIIGTNIERFDDFLNLLIEKQTNLKKNISLWCEMIPHKDLNDGIIKKMATAGFSEIFIGYESISDSILKKMNKSNDFALNILVVKSALKHGIRVRTNLIKGIPDETKEDVLESIKNLHYLRFYLGKKKNPLNHIHGPFALHNEAKYYQALSEEEIMKYDSNPASYYIPESLLATPSILFGYLKKAIDNAYEWSAFSAMESLYNKRAYTYKLIKKGNKIFYTEFANKEEIKEIEFFEPDYIDVLRNTKDRVCSFDELKVMLQKKYKNISEKRIIEILQNLNAAYLLYFNEDMTRIISVIDIE